MKMKLALTSIYMLLLSTVLSFSAENQTLTELIIIPTERVADIEWSPDGSMIAFGSWDKIEIWDTETWELLTTISDVNTNTIAWHPDSSFIAANSGGGFASLDIWDAGTGELVRQIIQPMALIGDDLVWLPDGQQLLSDNGLRQDQDVFPEVFVLWDLAEKTPMTFMWQDFSNYYNPHRLALSGDGELLLTSGSLEGNWVPPPYYSLPAVRIWDMETRRTIVQLLYQGGGIAWSPDNLQFIVGRTIWDINAEGVMPTQTLDIQCDGTSILSWSDNQNIIAGIAYNFHDLSIWDAETGACIFTEKIDAPYSIRGLSWQPNSTQLAYSTLEQVVIRTFDFID